MDGRAGAPSNRRRNLLTTGDLVAGRFRLGRRVGEGGFGQVFEAADEQWGDRRVAVKILSPAAASDPEFRARFEREALSAEVAAHRHVLPVLSSGREGEFFYIAMPFVPESLADVLGDHGRLPPGRALRLCTQVALALDWAHSRGIVHRDVKPATVLLEHDATVGDHAYLADFGIAKAALAATVTRTEFGVP
ncbi:MAG: serine/threonine protein kinase, bacterial, partial [Thermoleophilaceae bacterium]|nr:serine/threonine protein kinase, bacterial [Thermoleophilaceae bacterium]